MKRHLSMIITSVAVLVALIGLSLGPVGRASADYGPTGTVNTGALNIRSGPGITYGVITSVYRGTSLTLLARNADASWVKVALSSGTQGWVNSRYITTTYPLYSLPVEGGVTPPPPTTRTHVVQPGENLFRIALRYGVNMYTLAAVNGITNLSYIYAGQVLIIP
jgi:uncharacterized protein YgiM (DUF1202 family)